ncbi:MAG: hypothetical protein NVSMB64_25970 [Candidatus Velthaea sp.]
MVVELFRHKRLSFEMYAAEHERDRRSFQRDLQQLRAIGEQSGFSISAIKSGSYVELDHFDAKIRALQREGTQSEQLIGDVARAMGQPIAAEIGHIAQTPQSDDERFFHFAVPKIVEGEGSSIAAISAELKTAWASKALVKFRYPDSKGGPACGERLVEPYRVLLRSGVFYLVGYDRGRRAWRTFALDRFLSTPVRAGSNNVQREIPAAYASDDVLGFIKSDETRTEVTVELNARVAASAVSRQWQAAQRVQMLPGGRARIVFTVSDVSEVARWAFGFGEDARIVAPPSAVRVASEMARKITAQHAMGATP